MTEPTSDKDRILARRKGGKASKATPASAAAPGSKDEGFNFLRELRGWTDALMFAFLLAIAAIPLARTEPRQPRYGQLILALLGYLLYTNLMLIGRAWIGSGVVPVWAGLWWVHLPAVALVAWLLMSDGRLPRPRVAGA